MHHLAQSIGIGGPLKIMGYVGFILVAVFFFLSGYGLKYGLDHKEKYLDGFLRKKLSPILVPFEIVNVFCLLFLVLTKKPIDWTQTLLSFFGWDYLTGLWFITAILIMYILFYVSFLMSRKYASVILFACVVAYIVIFTVAGLHSAWTASIIAFPVGVMWDKEKFQKWVRDGYGVKLLFATVLFFGLFLGRLFLSVKGFDYWFIQIPLRNLISVLFVIWIFTMFQKIGFRNNRWSVIGTSSLEIYMIHHTIILFLIGKDVEGSIYILVVILLSTVFVLLYKLIYKKVSF